MKNAKHFLALTGLLFLLTLTASAQRWHRGGYSRIYVHEYCHRPAVRVNVGIGVGNVAYRPYYRTRYVYGYRRPSVGVVISVLPVGYRTVYLGPNPYYYYSGVYYRPYRNNRYEVIDAPVGARVPELPSGADVEVINGQKFYEYEGTYYKEVITERGDILYEVVGKNAVLNTDEQAETNTISQPPAQPTTTQTAETIGLQTDKLPDNCKTVVINQQKLYASPSGFYYQEKVKDNKVVYEIVGKIAEKS